MVFEIRGARVGTNNLVPGRWSYVPNAWDVIRDLNINVLSLMGGIEGDTWHINIKAHPSDWAQNLDSLLALINSHGYRAYFDCIGSSWGNDLGINPPPQGGGPYAPVSVSEAKAMIDQLAGNNALGHDFITDPRIFGWIPENEPDFTSPVVLDWGLQVCDYIRGKGGKAWIASPRGAGGWYTGEDFHVTEPILYGHVDYLDRHLYEVWDFANPCERNYQKFYDYYTSVLQSHVLDGRGRFPVESLIIGEFGIWLGTASDLGYSGTFTDEERAVYYQAVTDALRDKGIKNVVFHILFPQQYQGVYESPDYSIVNINGSYYLPANIVKTAYATPISPLGWILPIGVGLGFIYLWG